MKSLWVICFSIWVLLPSAGAQTTTNDMPVAPIAASEFNGWTNTYRLKNAVAEAILVPRTGRLAVFALVEGRNIFRLDPALAGMKTTADETSWHNFGGDWLWPVAQSRWTMFADKDWPPPPALADKPWQGNAWKSADGSQSCLMTREFGSPLHIRVSRLFKLDAQAPRLTVSQKIERTGVSDIPVTLWNISQVSRAEAAVLPVDQASRFDGGCKPMLFEMPPTNVLRRCQHSVVYVVGPGQEHKLGSDSIRAWIAARRDKVVLLETARTKTAGAFPDGGCTVELYSNAGLGYSEIETLSPEILLLPGEVLENKLVMELLEPSTKLQDCELADYIRSSAGDDQSKP